MPRKISKTEAKNLIEEFFARIKHKTSKEVERIKKLAMNHNIKLGDKRKLFCKKCLAPHENSSINIKNNFMNMICANCGYKNRWKLNKELDFEIKYKEIDADGCC